MRKAKSKHYDIGVTVAPKKKLQFGVKPLASVSNTSGDARRRLRQVGPSPPKRPLRASLTRVALRLHGGKRTFMGIARHVKSERIQEVVRRWEALSRADRRYISLDTLCEAVGVPPGEFLRAVISAAFEQNYDLSSLIAAIFDPDQLARHLVEALAIPEATPVTPPGVNPALGSFPRPNRAG